MGEYPHGGVAEALAPTTHPADVLGLQGGAHRRGGKGATKPPTRLRSRRKTTTAGAIPGVGRADRGPESTPSPSGVDNSTTQHWGGEVELVGENDLEPLNMIHHDSFNTGKSMTAGGPSSGGHAQSEGAASTETCGPLWGRPSGQGSFGGPNP